MNDRFKFRVWNKEQKKLYSWDDLKKSKGDNSFYWCMLQAQNDEKNNILMQCTGLKDKNGKLIYEGDICLYNFNDIGKQKAIIYYNEKLASFLAKPLNDFQYTNLNACEVIGNIYENKELLD